MRIVGIASHPPRSRLSSRRDDREVHRVKPWVHGTTSTRALEGRCDSSHRSLGIAAYPSSRSCDPELNSVLPASDSLGTDPGVQIKSEKRPSQDQLKPVVTPVFELVPINAAGSGNWVVCSPPLRQKPLLSIPEPSAEIPLPTVRWQQIAKPPTSPSTPVSPSPPPRVRQAASASPPSRYSRP
jgi:hypothetical protein